jgi:hypothetical protein
MDRVASTDHGNWLQNGCKCLMAETVATECMVNGGPLGQGCRRIMGPSLVSTPSIGVRLGLARRHVPRG